MAILSKKSIIFVSVNSSMSNPNGNIDNGEPRRTFNDCGIISPMSMKRKLRDLLEDPFSPITKQIYEKYDINPELNKIFESRSRGMTGCESEKEAFDKAMEIFRESEEVALAMYLDLRWFGGTILEEIEREKKAAKGKGKESEDLKDSVRFIRRGVVQFDMFSSVRPIETVIGGITRKASTQRKNQEGEDRSDSAGSMGQGAIKVVRHAVYEGAIRISPFDAHKTNTSEEDISLLKNLIKYLFLINSAQRTGCEIVQAVCMEHPDGLGVLNDSIFINACRSCIREGFSPSSPSESIAEYKFRTIDEIRDEVSKHKNGGKVIITNLLD